MTESLNPTESVSLGQQLKQAREALGLSVEDVAKKTNLKKSHIESLENDIFILQNVAPTFVRGYVRNYVRFLRLPEELVSSVNYGEVILPKTVVNNAQPSKVQQKSQSQWVKYLTIAVLLGAVGMTLLWWYQDYQKEQENRDQYVIAANTPAENSVSSANSNEIALPALSQNSTSAVPAAQQPAPVVEAPAPAPQPEPAPVVENTPAPAVETAPVAEVAPTPAEEAAPAPAAAEETPVLAANVLQQTAPAEEAQTATEATPAAIGNDELRIEITGKESWITVKGAKSKKSLAEKLYTTGEVLTFNDNEQYRLTIGAPANVKLYYKGEEVPLKIDGRVARIKLPLQ